MNHEPKAAGRALIATNDPSVFTVPSQTSINDRTSLLRLQNLVAQRNGAYVYYEVGSHLGGTLVPHLLDERCASIISIDPRPQQQPDARGQVYKYQDNSTARMIQMLKAAVPEAALQKLQTFDLDARALPLDGLPKADLLLIDGEHTNAAAFSDFLSLHDALSPNAVVAFHDANLICDALVNVERFLSYNREESELVILPDCVCAIGLGASRLGPELTAVTLDRPAFERASRLSLQHQLANHAISKGTLSARQLAKALWKRATRRPSKA